MKAVVSYAPQPQVIARHLRAAGVTHDQTVRADVVGLRADLVPDAKRVTAGVFCCDIQQIKVLQTVKEGDGGQVPDRVQFYDLQLPDDTFRDFNARHLTLKNALIHVDGAVQVIQDKDTKVELQPVGVLTRA